MSLSPTTLTSAEQLQTIEKVVNGKGNNQIKKASPFLYALMGMNETFVAPIPKRIGRTIPLLAGYLEAHYIIDDKAISPVTDNTDAMSPVTPAIYSPAQALRFKGTLYSDTAWISDLELEACNGAPKPQAERFIERQVRALIASAHKELATALYTTNEQSRNSLSGLGYWIDDNNTIGIDGFTHTRAAGGPLASNMDEVAEALTELKFMTLKTKNSTFGGKNDLCLGDATAVAKLWSKFTSKDQVQLANDGKWANYGAEYYRYGHTVIAPDPYCTPTTLYVLDLESILWGMNPAGLTIGEFKDYLGVRAAKGAKWQVAAALIVEDPRKCGLINNYS